MPQSYIDLFGTDVRDMSRAQGVLEVNSMPAFERYADFEAMR